VTRSDPTTGQLSGYAFPEAVRVDELLLRAPIDGDIDLVAPAFLDPEVGGEAGLPPVGAPALRAMLHEQLPTMRERGLLAAYVVEDTETGALLGGCSLHHFDPMRDAVEVGYWLFVDARGRGVATRAVGALVDHAFANGLRRVEAHVRPENRASERVLERLGFEREGVRRAFLRHGAGYSDATIWSRLVDDA
jgi:ribosomal-protein-alanine N-acetyltransferase